jgi:hypothetical protein
LRDRHLEYFLRLAENAAPYLIRPEQLEWLDRLEADHDNLRLALEWALNKEVPEPSLRLGAALGDFWAMRCYWLEGTKWLHNALTKPSQPSERENLLRVRARYQEAALAQHLDDLERMKASAAESFALAQTDTDRRDLAIARFYVAYSYWRDVDFQKAYPLFEESLVDFRSLNDLYWETISENFVSLILISAGKKRLTDEVVSAVERAYKESCYGFNRLRRFGMAKSSNRSSAETSARGTKPLKRIRP